jgi:hypothetical protein
MFPHATQLMVRFGPVVLTTAGASLPASLPAIGAATVILAVGGAVALVLVDLGLGCRLAAPAPVAVILPVALRQDGAMDPAGG